MSEHVKTRNCELQSDVGNAATYYRTEERVATGSFTQLSNMQFK